jgi:hypothetical protein
MPVTKIAEVTFTSADRVRDVIHNFNADGFDSLYPKYKGGRTRGAGPRGGLRTCWPAVQRERPELALVLITHDLEVAAVATRIAVLNGGEVVERGRPVRC